MNGWRRGAISADMTVQGAALRLGLHRRYFDAREGVRARRGALDLEGVRRAGTLFVHVPKCAGTSIIKQADIARGHRSAQLLRRRDPELFERCFTFGIVRDPYDRLVSAFHYLRSDKTSARDGHFGRALLGRYDTFGQFAEDLASPATRRRILPWLHFLPQTYFLCDRRGAVLVDFVGRVETLDRDIETIARRSGIAFENIRERHVEREPWQRHYTSETKRIVGAIYAADFEAFGYER